MRVTHNATLGRAEGALQPGIRKDVYGRGVITGATSTGVARASVVGRVVVLRDYDAVPIACALVRPMPALVLRTNGFVRYPAYTGKLSVRGEVFGIATHLSTYYYTLRQTFSIRLSGLDERCRPDFGSAQTLSGPNSCGVRFNVGTSCAADTGANLFLPSLAPLSEVDPHAYLAAIDGDPWANNNPGLLYCASGVCDDQDRHGRVTLSYTLHAEVEEFGPALTGMAPQQLIGHTVVVHDYDGRKVACAVLFADDGSGGGGGGGAGAGGEGDSSTDSDGDGASSSTIVLVSVLSIVGISCTVGVCYYVSRARQAKRRGLLSADAARLARDAGGAQVVKVVHIGFSRLAGRRPFPTDLRAGRSGV